MGDGGGEKRRRKWLDGAVTVRGLMVVVVSIVSACTPSEASDPPTLVPTSRHLLHEADGERLYSLTFQGPGRRPISAYLREPIDLPPGGRGGLVLAAGRHAGQDAAAMMPRPLQHVVLALEYPEAIPRRITVLGWSRRLPSFVRAARRMPDILRGGGHYLATHPGVDATDLTLVGVSFGVPFAAAAGRDRVFTGVALHFGGADIAGMLDANLPIRNGWVRSAFSRFGAWVFRDLEPARHVGQIAPTPLLVINGTEDQQIPAELAALLSSSASEPVRHIWLEHGHLSSRDVHLISELADSTFRHFRAIRAVEVGPPLEVGPS